MCYRLWPRPAMVALAAVAALFAARPEAKAQVGPEDSAKRVKPAEGLKATLWASEPMVINPTNLDIDSRGRVWITEGLNYRLTLHRGQTKIEDADRIKILEDTDGDGKADKVTVFADKIFPVPMGIAVEERYDLAGKYLGCKVYVGNSPDLLVLEDTDGDDKADKRYPLLTGFGGYDHDHGVHGMILGPDGKLYFTQGDGQSRTKGGWQFEIDDKTGRRVGNNRLGTTLRADRDGGHFEILADKHRNPYETSLTSFGDVFTSDNDDDGNHGCRVIHVLDGASYGYHTSGSPRHWGEDVPGNMPKLVGTGNGSPSGIMVYEGSLLPKEYMGSVLEIDAGTRQVNFFPLTRVGASFRTESGVMLGSDDSWFRPIDACAAPDGSVFVADWYDGGVGGHGFRDSTTGRIYRVAPIGKKVETVKADFGSVHGLITALRSPAVATRDAARRGLIEHTSKDRQGVEAALVNLFSSGEPHERARALWTLHAIAGDSAAVSALKNADPRIRELAVRILGRDDREVGQVEYLKPEAKTAPLAEKNLDALLPLASDPDAGVRRELILALRKVPTAQAGDALKTLARAWDGRDRWYLECLGLALQDRESDYLAGFFDGTFFGSYGAVELLEARKVAVPPYFPVDRNEAFMAVGEPERPASSISKTLGLAWRLHRPEVLDELRRVIPKLASPDLQQAGDDVLSQMRDPQTAVVLAEIVGKTDDPARQRQLLATLATRLDTIWRDARLRPEIVTMTEDALKDPELRLEAIDVAAATGDSRYAPLIFALARDAKASAELREAAVEAAARVDQKKARELVSALIDEAKARGSSSSPAEAAVRSLTRLGDDPREKLLALIDDKQTPLGLRREALRSLTRYQDGGRRLLDLVRDKKISDDLTKEASSLLSTHPDRTLRDAAARVLPQPKGRGGRPLPSFYDMVRKDGHAERGRDVFFRAGANSCSGCHRVQGRGQWIGPDLSTIGIKYGRDELLRSILYPSAAIGHGFRGLVVSLQDGRVLTGLAVEDSPDRLVLKTATGERVSVRPDQVDDRKESEVSLMPEGLAETMNDQDLADLLSFLSTLKQPVSIVGQYQVIGPLVEAKGMPAFDTSKKVDVSANLRGPEGQKLAWRRLDTNAESLADLGTLLGDSASKSAYLYAPVVSAIPQQARLVLDTKADLNAWLNGKGLDLPDPSDGQSRTLVIDLPAGKSDLLLRVSGGPSVSIVTTLVTDRPVSFRAEEKNGSGR